MDAGHNCEAHLERLRGEMMEKIATLNSQVGIALAGVGNFKKFQEVDFPALKLSVDTFHTTLKTREIEKEKAVKAHDRRMNVRIGVVSILSVLLIGGGTIAEMRHEDQNRSDMQQTLQRSIRDSVHAELGAKK